MLNRGNILGIVPKIHLPNYGEFYEARHFASGRGVEGSVKIGDQEVAFGSNLLFTCEELPGLTVAAEICED